MTRRTATQAQPRAQYGSQAKQSTRKTSGTSDSFAHPPGSTIKQVRSVQATKFLGLELSVTSLQHLAITTAVTLALQTVFSALVEQTQSKELGSVSRHYKTTYGVLGLTAWKVLELAVGWFAGYGNVAIAPFIALLRLPHMYLLNAFYDVSFLPLFFELITHFTAASLAFSIFRRPDVYKPVRSSGVIDRTMRGDILFQITTTTFSSALYALPIIFSIYSWLLTHLAIHWDGLRTFEKAHASTIMSTSQHLIGMGWCTMYLLLDYVPLLAEDRSDSARKENAKDSRPFDAKTASLMETIGYNIDGLLFWRHAKPAGRALLKHSAFLALCLTIDTAFQSCATVEGCDISGLNWLAGPLPWGSLWGLGMLASGVGLGWTAGVWL